MNKKEKWATVVETSLGPLKGVRTCYRDFNYYTFKNIPYAQVPINDLRFAPPQEISTYIDCKIRNRKVDYAVEDVLYLNVFTPEIMKSDTDDEFNRPVLVMIPELLLVPTDDILRFFNPDFFFKEDIVIVVISYRAGVFGSLGFKNPEANAPGNLSILDIIVALKWIQREIHCFGGDNTNIVACGHGNGGNFVRKLIAEPEIYFHKAIISSWFYPTHLNTECNVFPGSKIAKKLNFTGNLDDDVACVEFLRSLSADEILGVPYSKDYRFTKLVVPEDLEEIARDTYYKQKLPVLIGYNSEPGIHEHILFGQLLRTMTIHSFIQRIRKDPRIKSLSDIQKMLSNLFRKYENPEFETDKEEPALKLEVISDLNYIIPALVLAKSLARDMRKVYLYRFDVDLSLNIVKNKFNYNYPGASHGDSMGYLWKHPKQREQPQGSSLEVSQWMVKTWTHFAQTGDPNSPEVGPLKGNKWKPIHPNMELTHCLHITDTGMKYDEIPERQRMVNFYEKVFSMQFLSGIVIVRKPKESRNIKAKKIDNKK